MYDNNDSSKQGQKLSVGLKLCKKNIFTPVTASDLRTLLKMTNYHNAKLFSDSDDKLRFPRKRNISERKGFF